ncbi:hypothetical protein ACFQ7B_43395, partial [Streptomyces erythrochromogenes]
MNRDDGGVREVRRHPAEPGSLRRRGAEAEQLRLQGEDLACLGERRHPDGELNAQLVATQRAAQPRLVTADRRGEPDVVEAEFLHGSPKGVNEPLILPGRAPSPSSVFPRDSSPARTHWTVSAFGERFHRVNVPAREPAGAIRPHRKRPR